MMVSRLAVAICLAFIGSIFSAGQLICETNLTETSIGALPKDLNIHYTGRYCLACHEQLPEPKGDPFLKFSGDPQLLCQCHVSAESNYIHPVSVEPSAGKKNRIPEEFPLRAGKIECVTCHDISLQCLEKKGENSLRGAPYKKKADFCFTCHDENSYMMSNVHDQIDEKGAVIEKNCLYCHLEKPDVDYIRYEDIRLRGEVQTICQGCHVIRGNHSGNFNHMVKPSPKALEKIKQIENKFDIILPLDKKGMISCSTCHNPHERGVIPEDRPAAKGADAKFKHRLPNRMCAECHGF